MLPADLLTAPHCLPEHKSSARRGLYLYFALCKAVQAAGGLIEQQYARVFQDRSGKGHPLLLPCMALMLRSGNACLQGLAVCNMSTGTQISCKLRCDKKFAFA